jgi:hypothetical protein
MPEDKELQAKLKGYNYVCVMDNFFTSMKLAVMLLTHLQMWLIGTFRRNRMGKAGLPHEVKTMPKAGVKGEAIVMKTTQQNVDIYHTSWRDNKVVNLLSTVQPLNAEVSRASSDNGGYARIIIPQPHVIKKYNIGMGGVDLCDQRLSYYRTNVKSKKWAPRLIFHFMALACNNAHVLMKLKKKLERNDTCYTYLGFLRSLTTSLLATADNIEKKEKENEQEGQAEVNRFRKQASWKHDSSRLIGVHNPVAQIQRDCAKPRCKVCRQSTVILCQKCDEYLCCTVVEKADRSCWELFHSESYGNV